MGEEQNEGAFAGEQQGSAGPLPPSAGQRLDQFISSAQRLSSVAHQKAREAIEAAAPKLKDLREAASTHGGRLLQGSLMDRVRAYFNSGSRTRKGLMIYGGGMGALTLLSFLILPIMLLIPDSPGPDQANYEKVQSGMTETQVDKLLGAPSAIDRRLDGSLAKTWTPTATDEGPIHVTFVDGKVGTKTMDEPTTSDAPTTPAVVANTASPLTTASPAAAPMTSSNDDGQLVASDVSDSWLNSAKDAAERHARGYADQLRQNLYDDGGGADFYDVEKTAGADGNTIPNEYVAVIYLKSGMNAFGTHKETTLNLFYKYKPETKQLFLANTKQADHGFAK